jgi:hypothetical protein
MRTCPECGLEFQIISWKKNKFCSHECSVVYQTGRARPELRCKAGRRRRRPRRIKVNGKSKMLHRVIMEEKLGRQLDPRERVHHIDCDERNNGDGNLYLFDNARQHQVAHRSIDRLIKPLLLTGVIEFNGGRYELTQRKETADG